MNNKPFNIGSIEIKDPVILAPLSGVTDLPFRKLVKRFGAGLVVSEMIASRAMILETKQSLLKAKNIPEEFPMSVQLAGCEPEIMAEAAKLNADHGAVIIDINMGCPVKKIVNNFSGSFLMKNELLASKIMEATVKSVNLPVTLKMRTGWDDQNRNAPKLAKIAEDCGIQMITIHGRTRTQLFNGKPDWKFIKEIKKSVSIPVIANGDVKTLEDVKNIFHDSGADGVMVGRGTYGKPWFLGQIIHYLKTGESKDSPKLNDQLDIILEHVNLIVDHYGEYTGIRMARKHLGWYSKSMINGSSFRHAINQLEDIKSLTAQVIDFYTHSENIPNLKTSELQHP